MMLDDIPRLKLEEPWMYERFVNYLQNSIGPAFIIEEEGRSICAFGALFEWGPGGACEVWFNLIEQRRTFNIARTIKRLIVKNAEQYKIKRMQAIVECGNAVNNRFMKFLGFINETPFGMKNKLHNGRPAYLYSRCF
jgi:hypothetical protein